MTNLHTIDLEKAEAWQKEKKRLQRLIRSGVLPRFHLAKGKDGNLEREFKNRRSRLTWRQVSTLVALMDEMPKPW